MTDATTPPTRRHPWRQLASRRWWQGRRWPLVVLLALLVTGGLLFLAQDPRTLQVHSAHRAADPEFPRYLAALLNTPLVRGNRYVALRNGDEIYPRMIAAIDAAAVRVAFETYNFMAGEAADRFIDALVRAARRGVSVRVIIDTVGAVPPPAGLREAFEAAGVRLVWFNPVGVWTMEATNNRTHRKLLIVDGETVFTGGVGVADHWLGNARDEREWRDTHFEVTGPVVQALEACFFENWIEAGGTDPPAMTLDPSRHPDEHAPSLVLWSNPTVGVSNIKLLYLTLIAAADRSIDIQSPYFVLDSSVRLALARARERGVALRVLTDGEITDTMSVKHASRAEYLGVLEMGGRVFEYRPTMMHVKTLVVDGRWSVIGSANFDNRSLELNDEVAVAIDDEEFAAALTRHFDEDLTSSREWTIDEWRRRPWHWKVRQAFWGLFGEVF
jgi:cardiolipin synthase